MAYKDNENLSSGTKWIADLARKLVERDEFDDSRDYRIDKDLQEVWKKAVVGNEVEQEETKVDGSGGAPRGKRAMEDQNLQRNL